MLPGDLVCWNDDDRFIGIFVGHDDRVNYPGGIVQWLTIVGESREFYVRCTHEISKLKIILRAKNNEDR